MLRNFSLTHIDDVDPRKLHLDAGLVVVARRHPEEVVERLLDVLRPRQVAVQGLQDLGLGPETGHSLKYFYKIFDSYSVFSVV